METGLFQVPATKGTAAVRPAGRHSFSVSCTHDRVFAEVRTWLKFDGAAAAIDTA
ncbi:hypothetical protein D3C74_497270 [compost metagenome]